MIEAKTPLLNDGHEFVDFAKFCLDNQLDPWVVMSQLLVNVRLGYDIERDRIMVASQAWIPSEPSK